MPLSTETIYYSSIETPLGAMLVCTDNKGIITLNFVEKTQLLQIIKDLEKQFGKIIENPSHPYILLIKKELELYFSGQLKEFSVPIHFIGTEFQKAVWESLMNIPYGTTISYKQQAEQMNAPKAIRAIASANGKNNIAIVVPCHRVIGSDGSLIGYAGGIWRKEFLLKLEKSILF